MSGPFSVCNTEKSWMWPGDEATVTVALGVTSGRLTMSATLDKLASILVRFSSVCSVETLMAF